MLTIAFGRAGLLRQLETTALDTQLRLRQSADKESDVVVVRITDRDYEELFKSKSPLDPTALKTLLTAIAACNPKVIGVDIDTSSPQFQQLQPDLGWPPVVWARTAVYSNINKRFRVSDVLGNQSSAPASGIVMVKEDSDGAVRRYSRKYSTYDSTHEGESPSLVGALVAQFDPKRSVIAGKPEDDFFIRYTGYKTLSPFFHVDAAKMIQYANESNCDLIKNKIVVLGGAYKASDEHDTPFGWMTGVDILAHTIETELDGGGLKPAPKSAIILFEIFDGFLLLLLFQRFRFGKATLLGVVAIPILSITCSLVAFRSVAFWAYFAPILVAILVQQLWEQAKEYRKTLTKDLADGEAGKSKTPDPEKQNSHSHGRKRNQRRLRVR